MLQISFIGTNATLNELQNLLKDYAILVRGGKSGAIICEVSEADDLRQIPPKPAAPMFLYITTQDKTVIGRLKAYKITGIFFPPLDGQTLKKKISSALTLSQSQNSPNAVETKNDFDTLRVKILAKAENIATLPVFAQKLLALTGNNTSTIQEITGQIKMDQGISGRVIRMINSPFFGIRREISSIDRAVVMLGFNTLKNIALVAATNAHYNKNFAMYKTTGNALWQHTYITAIIAEEMALEMNMDHERFFLAGLLHDIGKTVLADFLVKEVNSDVQEREQLGIDHAELAGLILERWQLPDDIIRTVRLHHRPDSTRETQIIHYANRLANTGTYKGELFGDCLTKIFKVLPIKNQELFAQKVQTILQNKSEDTKEGE